MLADIAHRNVIPTGQELVLIGIVVFTGGLITGITGFGYAIFATATLASVFDPQTAVVIVLIPIVAANLSLVRELERDGLRSCARRFWPFVTAAVVGTLFGMVLLARVPTEPLTAGLGLFTLGYVLVSQPWITLPGEQWAMAFCVSESNRIKGVLGLFSGVVFGATNVGVQVIAYLESFDLDHSTFVGVVAMVFLGIGGMRILMAWALGLYASTDLLLVSTAAAVPGLLGVSAGKRFRPLLSGRQRSLAIYILLTIVGSALVESSLPRLF